MGSPIAPPPIVNPVPPRPAIDPVSSDCTNFSRGWAAVPIRWAEMSASATPSNPPPLATVFMWPWSMVTVTSTLPPVLTSAVPSIGAEREPGGNVQWRWYTEDTPGPSLSTVYFHGSVGPPHAWPVIVCVIPEVTVELLTMASRATVQGNAATVAPWPATRARNVCRPGAAAIWCGDVHAANPPPSTEHSNAEAASEENSNAAVLDDVLQPGPPHGPDTIATAAGGGSGALVAAAVVGAGADVAAGAPVAPGPPTRPPPGRGGGGGRLAGGGGWARGPTWGGARLGPAGPWARGWPLRAPRREGWSWPRSFSPGTMPRRSPPRRRRGRRRSIR